MKFVTHSSYFSSHTILELGWFMTIEKKKSKDSSKGIHSGNR